MLGDFIHTVLLHSDEFVPHHFAKGLRHSDPQATQYVERLPGWSVSTLLIEEELRRQNSSTIDFSLCLGATATDKLAARTKSKSASIHPIDKKDEVVALYAEICATLPTIGGVAQGASKFFSLARFPLTESELTEIDLVPSGVARCSRS